MYTFRILLTDSTPFTVITDLSALEKMIAILNARHIQFQVFQDGNQLMPKYFGYGDFKSWVQEFNYETSTPPRTTTTKTTSEP